MQTIALWVFIALIPSALQGGDLGWAQWKDQEQVRFGGFIMEMHSFKVLNRDGQAWLIYGDRVGRIHLLKQEDGRFIEEWISASLRSAVAEIFVADINDDAKLEIVAYTEAGDIVFYRLEDYKQLWRSTDNEYETIATMVLENVDDDPQLELIFCAEDASEASSYRTVTGDERDRASQIGRLFVFDCKNLFTEWNSEQGLTAQSILVGDLDDDGILEIILNTGFVIDAAYQRVEWERPDGFGEKIGFVDVDGDGLPELVGEYQSTTSPRRFIRIFDVDLQSESFLNQAK